MSLSFSIQLPANREVPQAKAKTLTKKKKKKKKFGIGRKEHECPLLTLFGKMNFLEKGHWINSSTGWHTCGFQLKRIYKLCQSVCTLWSCVCVCVCEFVVVVVVVVGDWFKGNCCSSNRVGTHFHLESNAFRAG